MKRPRLGFRLYERTVRVDKGLGLGRKGCAADDDFRLVTGFFEEKQERLLECRWSMSLPRVEEGAV